jgi:hypothetical protein
MLKKLMKPISLVIRSVTIAIMFSGVSNFVAAAPAANPTHQGMGGQGITGIQIQNLSQTDSTTLVPELYNQTGGSPISLPSSTLGPLASANYYMGSYNTVSSSAYSLAVSSNTPIAAIVRTDWSSTGGAAIYGSTTPSTDVSIPAIFKNFANQTSQFTIQNTDTSNDATDVVITLYGRGLTSPVVTTPPQTIGAGRSMTFSMNDALWGASLPNTGLDMGATGFVGTVRVQSSKPLVAQSFIDIAGSQAVTGFSGVPTNSAANTLYFPLIRANYYGDTGISLLNPNSGSVSGTITFTADSNSPHGGTYTQDFSIPGNSSFVAFQGPGGNSRSAPTNLPGGTQTAANPVLTNNGFYGVATVTADGNLLGTVNDTKFGSGWSVLAQSTYNGATSVDAGTKFALPLVRRFHLSTTQLTTGIQIQNVSNSTITAHLDLTNWDGTSQSASNPPDLTIAPYASGNYWNGNITGLPTVPQAAGGYGWYGSAVLTITGGTAVVVVSDEGYGSTAIDSANYNGIKIQ